MASELIFQWGPNLTATDTINDIDFTEEQMNSFCDINRLIDESFDELIDKFESADVSGFNTEPREIYQSTKASVKNRLNHFKSELKNYIQRENLEIAVVGLFYYTEMASYGSHSMSLSGGTLRISYYPSYADYNTYKQNWNTNYEGQLTGTGKYRSFYDHSRFNGRVYTIGCNLPSFWTESSSFDFRHGYNYQNGDYWTRGCFSTANTDGTTSYLKMGVASSGIGTSSYDRYNSNGKDTATSGKYPSGEMGGLGTFDDSTDLSDISTKPTLNLSDLGFFSVWNPSSAELRQLANYVWNDPANVAQWPQIFRDGILKPMDYIISLALYPFSSSLYDKINTTFCMGGIPFDGGITSLQMTIHMDKITEQFIDIDMGTVDLKEYFGSFLDYAPYSQISLYLPYYGVVQLSMNEVQNADSIKILYRVNILDGSTAIKVHIDRQTSAAQNGSVPLKHVLYEYFTNLKTEIPLTSGASAEQMKMLATVMSATITAAAPIAGAGASHIAGAVQGAATLGGLQGATIGAGIGNQAVGQAVEKGLTAGAQMGNKIINSLPSGGAITRGNIGGMNTGLLSERRPFLIITRPIQVLPENYKEENGYCASIKTTLSTLQNGFVQCESVDTTGLDATASEKEEIVRLLQQGVYI